MEFGGSPAIATRVVRVHRNGGNYMIFSDLCKALHVLSERYAHIIA